MKFILGYLPDAFVSENNPEFLTEFKDKATADFESEEWCEVEADTLEEAKLKYEAAFEAWRNAEPKRPVMVAKLVTVSVTTRVIVPEKANDEQIMTAALPRLVNNLLTDGVLDHIDGEDGIVDDVELPYNPETDK